LEQRVISNLLNSQICDKRNKHKSNTSLVESVKVFKTAYNLIINNHCRLFVCNRLLYQISSDVNPLIETTNEHFPR